MTHPVAPRARLSGGEKALIVVVAVLVVVFLVLLADRVGGSRGAAAPTTGGSAGVGESSQVLDLEGQRFSFRLPSGNIGCAMSPDGVLCAIVTFDYTPPAVPGCEADTGVAFALDDAGAAALCTSGIPDFGEVAVLPYGESLTVGDYTCESSEQGIRCGDAAGHGFSLRRSAYTL